MADALAAAPIRFIAKRLILAGLTVGLTAALFGCGIKGPPVPPRTPPIPTVTGLAYQLDASAVTLTWQLSEPLSKARAQNARFGVYQSIRALDLPVCESCPVVFEKIITLAYTHSDNNQYTTDVFFDPAYRYTFKVRLDIGGRTGPDSNLVTVNDNATEDISGN
jgi:hypothetical protein